MYCGSLNVNLWVLQAVYFILVYEIIIMNVHI